jgi:hypothetical protein
MFAFSPEVAYRAIATFGGAEQMQPGESNPVAFGKGAEEGRRLRLERPVGPIRQPPIFRPQRLPGR